MSGFRTLPQLKTRLKFFLLLFVVILTLSVVVISYLRWLRAEIVIKTSGRELFRNFIIYTLAPALGIAVIGSLVLYFLFRDRLRKMHVVNLK